jgi:hypothetical protein
MRATIELPDPIFRRMKAVAAMQGSTIKDFVRRAVERELAPMLTKPNKRGHRVKLPLTKGTPGHVIQPVTGADVDEMLFGEREAGSARGKKRRGGKLPLIEGAGHVIKPLTGEEMDELLFG